MTSIKKRIPQKLLAAIDFCHINIKEDDEGHIVYNPSDLPDDEFDLVLIDAPPRHIGKNARYGTLKWACKRINKDGSVYLDDYSRSDERESVKMILENDNNLRVTVISAEKGLARIWIKDNI